MKNHIVSTCFSMNLIPRKLNGFDEIQTIAHLDQHNIFFCKNDKYARERFLMQPKNIEPVEVVLYYGGINNTVSIRNFQEVFHCEGLRVIDKPAPSLFVDACAFLTEEKLSELGLSHEVNIALITACKDNLMYMSEGHHCSLELSRKEGYRQFSMTCVYQQWVNYAFLLCR